MSLQHSGIKNRPLVRHMIRFKSSKEQYVRGNLGPPLTKGIIRQCSLGAMTCRMPQDVITQAIHLNPEHHPRYCVYYTDAWAEAKQNLTVTYQSHYCDYKKRIYFRI